MHLIQVFLPITAARNSLDEIQNLRRSLTDKFGGVTIYSQAPAQGDWRAFDEAPIATDALVIIETMVAHFDREWWRALKSSLEISLQEQDILIRALPMERV